ncbi:MAG: type VI secretion system contractile sheath small subunit [Geminicoccaceae bacterium]
MSSTSIQHKLDRVRPPRVQITYDVETGDAIHSKELPFVVGVMADLSHKRAEPLPPMKQRKFVEIDRDNFNEVMESAAPRVAFQVDNQLAKDDSKLNIELNFKTMGDFDPVRVVEQVPSLRRLLEARNRLRDLLTKLDGNDELDAMLSRVITSQEERGKLEAEVKAIAVDTPADEGAAADQGKDTKNDA